MSWFYAYLCMAAVAYLPRLAMTEPMSPFTAPWRVWVLRLLAVLNPREAFPPRGRLRLALRWVVLLVNQVLWNFVWTLDDIFYPAYRDVDLSGAVFIVGASHHSAAVYVRGRTTPRHQITLRHPCDTCSSVQGPLPRTSRRSHAADAAVRPCLKNVVTHA